MSLRGLFLGGYFGFVGPGCSGPAGFDRLAGAGFPDVPDFVGAGFDVDWLERFESSGRSGDGARGLPGGKAGSTTP
ncbi:MAG: hypothetical protein ACI93T_002844, partial [Porticoccaceae bacterium]